MANDRIKEIDDKIAALEAEKAQLIETKLRQQTPVEKYLETYSGKKLLEKHSLDSEGTWEVRGEDPNCDMGGHHHNPYIGTFEGKLRDVLEIAVKDSQFWTWGGGGKIKKLNIISTK